MSPLHDHDQTLHDALHMTGGTFQITLHGRFSTGEFPYDASPDVINAAIEDLFAQAAAEEAQERGEPSGG